MKRILHTCTNCKYEFIDYLTWMPTWWCENPRRKGKSYIGYLPKERCRIFEAKERQ